MMPTRWQTIEQIFHSALEQDSGQLVAFLESACNGDKRLREEVERLLASHYHAGGFIEIPLVAKASKLFEAAQSDLLLGRTIGHYKVVERLGAGGMGEVYLATDIVAGRNAALKLLPLRFTGDPARLKRFAQEAHAVVLLNHPNIVTVYEIGEHESVHYIASELIPGETLRDCLAHGAIEVDRALDIATQVAGAFAAAHEAGIVHRDIKPENIMLRPDGYVKVLDFGIAKLAEPELPTSVSGHESELQLDTRVGSIVGTVRYMSPEQARGEPVDKSSDIWSLGVVLHEMVAGHALFDRDTQEK